MSCRQALYDYSLASGAAADGAAPAASLPQLHVQGFDAEQIWGQLDMQSGPLLKRIKRLMSRAGEAPALLQPQAEAQLDGERCSAYDLGSQIAMQCQNSCNSRLT